MGHHVVGLIAKPQTLEAFAFEHKLHKPIPLVQELAILPLREEDLNAIAPGASEPPEGLENWSKELSEELARSSESGIIVYFETGYFGGLGGQGAAVYADGSLVFGPKSDRMGPINEALRMLGVKVTPPVLDEFAAVGLTKYRNVEDWLSH